MRATWLIAATILAVVWVPVAILPVDAWVFALPVLLTVAVVAGTVAYDRKTSAGSADARKRALSTALSERLRGANPEQQLGITTMREDVRDAVAKLTGALPGQTARRAVEALPWYLVIGPAQAGKSNLLGATGLDFGYTTPAAGAWPSYRSCATSSPISRNGASASVSWVTRSRAVSLPCWCCFAAFSAPPPSRRRPSSARDAALSSRSR